MFGSQKLFAGDTPIPGARFLAGGAPRLAGSGSMPATTGPGADPPARSISAALFVGAERSVPSGEVQGHRSRRRLGRVPSTERVWRYSAGGGLVPCPAQVYEVQQATGPPIQGRYPGVRWRPFAKPSPTASHGR